MKNLGLFLLTILILTFNVCEKKVDITAGNKAMVERWVKLWITGDLTLADEILATDFVSHIPQFPDFNDLESYKKEVTKTRADVPDLQAILEDIVAEGNKVAGRFTARGTMHPAGVHYTNTWITTFRFAGGKIVEQWWYFDMLGVMQQIGAIAPSPEGPPVMQRSDPKDFVWSAASEVTGDSGDPEANKALVMREFEAWKQGNLDALLTVLDEIYAANFLYHDPARPHVTDLESYKKWAVEECFTPFPDLNLSVEDIIAEGDKVAVRWSFAGTHIAFGKQVTQTGSTIYRIADGKVVEAWCACDMMGTIQQMAAMAELEEKKAIVKRLVELWNTGDLTLADKLFKTDFVNHDLSRPDVTDLESYKGWIHENRTVFADFNTEVHDLIVEGDKVASRWTVTGTPKVEFSSSPPGSNQVTVTGMNMHRLVEGKIAEAWWTYDLLGMQQQLGIILPIPEAGLPALNRKPNDYLWSTSSEVTGSPGDKQTNKDLVLNEELEGWKQGNVDVALEVIAPNFFNHDPIWPGIIDYESYKQWVESELKSPLNLTVEDLVAEGDKVFERGMVDAGEGIIIPVMIIHRFADGKIVERWWSKDVLRLLQHLGIIPPQETGRK